MALLYHALAGQFREEAFWDFESSSTSHDQSKHVARDFFQKHVKSKTRISHKKPSKSEVESFIVPALHHAAVPQSFGAWAPRQPLTANPMAPVARPSARHELRASTKDSAAPEE